MKTDYFQGLSAEGFHRVAYTEWGVKNNTETPIVCVHGLTRNRTDFDPLADFLTYRGCHTFCPDVVGRGESDWLQNKLLYTYQQYVADMAGMITRTGAEKIDWIGTSMGGVIGMMTASLPNSPIRKLVMNDVGPQIPIEAVRTRIKRYGGKQPEFNDMQEAIAHFKKAYEDFGELTDKQWLKISETSVKESPSGKLISRVDPGIITKPPLVKMLSHLLTNPMQSLQGKLIDIDWWPIWQKIKCPVLVIHGEKSDILLSSTVEKMQNTHPNVDVIKVPNVGHAPSLFDTEHQEAIYDWLMSDA